MLERGDKQPMAVLTPKRHPIWRATQTHRKTANLLHHSLLCESSQQQWVHWRLPLPDPCSAAAKRCGLTSSSAVCAGPPSPSPGASSPGPPCGAAAAESGAPSCAAFHHPASARKNNTHSRQPGSSVASHQSCWQLTLTSLSGWRQATGRH